ncbi:MAG: dihydropteroate synthase [Crocinitomicaceae bacterium]
MLNVKGNLKTFNGPVVMGILNVTPDSFYEQSRVRDESEVLEKVEKMIRDGAEIVDIGGYSSRPGAKDISEEEELNRVVKVITAVRATYTDLLISIDTFRPAVAEAAILAGADMINDITGGQYDEEMYRLAAHYQTPYILMHMRGTPQNMQEMTTYKHLIRDISAYFSEQIIRARKAGVKDIIIDPGFGFSKTIEQNFELMAALDHFQLHDCPVLVGISRKSTIYKTLGITPEESLNGTTVLNTIALQKGAAILRVHDVPEAVQAIKLVERVINH